MVVGIEKVFLNQQFELRTGYLSQKASGKLLLEKIPCDANVFCSCVLDARTKPCEKTEGDLLIKCL